MVYCNSQRLQNQDYEMAEQLLVLPKDLQKTSSSIPLYTLEAKGLSRKESRKISHSVIEKRRREKINTCLSKLKNLVPGCKEFGEGVQKLTILEMTIDYILSLQASSKELKAAEEQETTGSYPSPSLSPEIITCVPKMAIASILN